MTPYAVVPVLAALLISLHSPPAAAERPSPSGKGAAVAPAPPQGAEEYRPFPKAGTRIPLGGGYTFVYGFDKTPKMGVHVMKVQVFAPSGAKDTSFEVLGDSDMPSMRGVHASGMQPFRLSKKGDYLLPVNIVMPGDWEVRFTFRKGGKVVLRGCHLFDV